MDTLPTHWLSLVAVVFLLGLKHGLDPDHLAAIDGLTRFNAERRPRLSRWSGLLFSAGHGVVVTMVAVLVATVATEWRAPGWLENAGTWISIAFLTLLGVANLAAAFFQAYPVAGGLSQSSVNDKAGAKTPLALRPKRAIEIARNAKW
jgi:high-affinity nickel-transport protein